jgi:hypothetical protein
MSFSMCTYPKFIWSCRKNDLSFPTWPQI